MRIRRRYQHNVADPRGAILSSATECAVVCNDGRIIELSPEKMVDTGQSLKRTVFFAVRIGSLVLVQFETATLESEIAILDRSFSVVATVAVPLTWISDATCSASGDRIAICGSRPKAIGYSPTQKVCLVVDLCQSTFEQIEAECVAFVGDMLYFLRGSEILDDKDRCVIDIGSTASTQLIRSIGRSVVVASRDRIAVHCDGVVPSVHNWATSCNRIIYMDSRPGQKRTGDSFSFSIPDLRGFSPSAWKAERQLSADSRSPSLARFEVALACFFPVNHNPTR